MWHVSNSLHQVWQQVSVLSKSGATRCALAEPCRPGARLSRVHRGYCSSCWWRFLSLLPWALFLRPGMELVLGVTVPHCSNATAGMPGNQEILWETFCEFEFVCPGRNWKQRWEGRPPGTSHPPQAATRVWVRRQQLLQLLGPWVVQPSHLVSGGGKVRRVKSHWEIWGEGTPRTSNSSFRLRRGKRWVPGALAFPGAARRRVWKWTLNPEIFFTGHGELDNSRVPTKNLQRGTKGGPLLPQAGHYHKTGLWMTGSLTKRVRDVETAQAGAWDWRTLSTLWPRSPMAPMQSCAYLWWSLGLVSLVTWRWCASSVTITTWGASPILS